MSRSSLSAWLLGLSIFLGGCGAHGAGFVSGVGPESLAPVHLEAWSYAGEHAKRVVTPHYVIYSTIANEEFLQSMGQLMEGALAEYRLLAPDLPETDRPMECYLFANRSQWAEFTKRKTGEDASIYLQINRGGYTVGDWYVAYWIGDSGTFCVASHEGFHQFAARHFQTRIPPFVEEGLACLFEDISWDGRLPRWDIGANYGRQAALRTAIDKKLLIPLSDLASMHAGQIINRSSDQIAGFYAQCWGFARFLLDYNGGQYRPALQNMLAAAADGTLYGHGMKSISGTIFWNPHSAKPLIEHYLQADFGEIDRQYQQYLLDLARNSAGDGGVSGGG